MILPITLTIAAVAAVLNLWLAVRIGQLRYKVKVSVGDGGNDALSRRMRAQSNFIEFTPIALILLGLVEMALGSSLWLWVAGMVYILGRIAHMFGMENDSKARGIGIMTTMLITLGLAICAIAIPYFTISDISTSPQPGPV